MVCDRCHCGRDSGQPAALPDLAALCAAWQQRLRLQDWRIECRYVPRETLVPDGSEAEISADIHWVGENKTASIRVMNPEELATDFMLRSSVEALVVHELLHLHFVAMDDAFNEPARKLLLEQMINLITGALVEE